MTSRPDSARQGIASGRVALRLGLLGLLCVGASGCSSVLTEGAAAGAGIGGTAIANAVTSNGAVAAGIGFGAQAAALAGTQYLEKVVHHAEQQRIADIAGRLPVGAVSTWSVHHRIPIEADEHGEVTVSRVISRGALDCKEIVFSVEHRNKRGIRHAFYIADVCRDGRVWRWAVAVPATERWGALQ